MMDESMDIEEYPTLNISDSYESSKIDLDDAN